MIPPKRSPSAAPVVLGLLGREPMHGYALFARIRDELHDVWHVGMNRLYALLIEMERDGLIRGRSEREGLRPPRRVFHPTAKGRQTFERWMHEPSLSMREFRVDFPPKLYFAWQRGPQDVAELVQAQRSACRRELERMTARWKDASAVDAFRTLIFDLRVRQIHSILDWLDSCEQQSLARRGTAQSARRAAQKTS
jgi:DNA-binding PadR family transcriptional regulator